MIVQTKRTIRSPLQKHKVRYQHHDKRSHCSADRFLDMDDGDEVHQINVDNKSAEQRIAQRHDIVRQWAGEQVEQYEWQGVPSEKDLETLREKGKELASLL